MSSRSLIFVLASGALFGFGLALSTMVKPEVVISFLLWKDMGLLLVLGGAVVVTFIAYHLVPRVMKKPWAGDKFNAHPSSLEPRTLVFYESPHRVRDTLEDCARILGAERPATVAREITKLHETTYRGSLEELLARASEDADFGRGEIVLLIGGAMRADNEDERGADGHGGALDRALKILLAELPLKQAARLAAQITEARDNQAYKRALLLKQT